MTKDDFYYGFTSFFDLDEQLKISENIIMKLKMNEEVLYGKDGYNKEISEKVRDCLILLLKMLVKRKIF